MVRASLFPMASVHFLLRRDGGSRVALQMALLNLPARAGMGEFTRAEAGVHIHMYMAVACSIVRRLVSPVTARRLAIERA